MDYQSPVVEQMGLASELIEASLGPRYDGDGYTFSQGLSICPTDEE